ncbi:MAG: hypothetical protein B6I20_12005, partial [Bacteroidetes bacterium 4572_117]
MEEVLSIIVILVIVFFSFAKFRYELQMIQQNSYRNERYIKWLKANIFNKIRIYELILFTIALASYIFDNNILSFSIII